MYTPTRSLYTTPPLHAVQSLVLQLTCNTGEAYVVVGNTNRFEDAPGIR